jgi:hypothetical protein
MSFPINKGIVKTSSEGGELYSHVLKDFNTGVEFPLNKTSMSYHELQEGDLVEFAGTVQGDCVYLAISRVDYRACAN